ncbi:CBS domain-containing protein [Moorena sp. SIO3A2]|uniref:CBS domain-containing protein n=1 Tax=Moorena sp. SIO3A2 TaxID=2607841 RepID=UPI0013B8677E|nr:CBS domain-containing protein [Moorena sp. SIO3A2]NER86792.1 CBS domain-containing protein [Moorena sp. SIO3A2]
MDLILCHTTVDFDALGAAVGLTRLKPGAKAVLTGGTHPAVRDFLALHRDEYALIERRSVQLAQINSVIIVDTQKRDRLGKAAEWLDLPQLKAIEIYDHHPVPQTDIPATYTQIEPVGATTTLIVEQLQQSQIQLTTAEATVMALGIHVDTGSLTFDQTTPRDGAALTWLMEQGANLRQIAQYVEPGLSPQLEKLFRQSLDLLQRQTHLGYTISWVFLNTPGHVPGLSSLASRLLEVTESDALLLGAEYQRNPKGETSQPAGLPVVRFQVEGYSPLPVGGLTVEGYENYYNKQNSKIQPSSQNNLETQTQTNFQSNHLPDSNPKGEQAWPKGHPTRTPQTNLGQKATLREQPNNLGQKATLREQPNNLGQKATLREQPNNLGQKATLREQPTTDTNLPYSKAKGEQLSTSVTKLTIIGRTRIEGTDLNQLLQPLGGGGHSQAAAVTLRDCEAQTILEQLVNQLKDQIPQPLTARDLMSSPVRTIRPNTKIKEAQRILLRYGHSGLSVVDQQDQLVGIISRRDLDLALHHGFGHAPVKGYMTKHIKTITPETSMADIQSLMVTYDIGRLPVLEDGQLMGIVTRTDVLRQLFQEELNVKQLKVDGSNLKPANLKPANIKPLLASSLWELLTIAAEKAQERGWHLYVVGGAVRDLLLADGNKPLLLNDIDLVVDGFHRSADAIAGVTLAKELRKIYRKVRLEVHGSFQTAALLWHNDPKFGSLCVDIATARTEFYPYPAANPQVEASSIRQDLYRRDFTINAMAARLTKVNPQAQLPLLDFFGGMLDLRSQKIRVLHANSFIEDPTRIYRAVRFAVRLGFEIEPQTREYIHYAIQSGVYERTKAENTKVPALQTRLKAELNYMLQAPYWQPALQLLSSLGALRCLHPTLTLDKPLWWRVRLVGRWLQRFDPKQTLRHWQMRLEVLIADLAPDERVKVAKNLQLPVDSVERLQKLEGWQGDFLESLPTCQLNSQIVHMLREYKLPTLVLIGVYSPRAIRRKIWQYLTTWRNVKAPLDGNDLRKLGYKPGAHYREILDALLEATLDRVIQDQADAKAFLAIHYPPLEKE